MPAGRAPPLSPLPRAAPKRRRRGGAPPPPCGRWVEGVFPPQDCARVAVYWARYSRYFQGDVVATDPGHRWTTVLYDDGERTMHDLRKGAGNTWYVVAPTRKASAARVAGSRMRLQAKPPLPFRERPRPRSLAQQGEPEPYVSPLRSKRKRRPRRMRAPSEEVLWDKEPWTEASTVVVRCEAGDAAGRRWIALDLGQGLDLGQDLRLAQDLGLGLNKDLGHGHGHGQTLKRQGCETDDSCRTCLDEDQSSIVAPDPRTNGSQKYLTGRLRRASLPRISQVTDDDDGDGGDDDNVNANALRGSQAEHESNAEGGGESCSPAQTSAEVDATTPECAAGEVDSPSVAALSHSGSPEECLMSTLAIGLPLVGRKRMRDELGDEVDSCEPLPAASRFLPLFSFEKRGLPRPAQTP
jgi:hypothetical protein